MGPGVIGHAEIKIGDSHLMIYCEDCDALYARAVAAGAKVKRPIENQFYGDRSGQVEDPFGHRWTISTHIEDVSSDEMKRRMAALEGA